MGLVATKMDVATESQTLNYVSTPPDVCLIPAPPPPTGPQGIPTPFPIMTTSGSVVKNPASKIKHKNKKLCNTKTVVSGIKGNEAGVGQLPPGMPKKDVITSVNRNNAKAFVGCPNVKMGGAPVVFVGSAGFGNIK